MKARSKASGTGGSPVDAPAGNHRYTEIGVIPTKRVVFLFVMTWILRLMILGMAASVLTEAVRAGIKESAWFALPAAVGLVPAVLAARRPMWSAWCVSFLTRRRRNPAVVLGGVFVFQIILIVLLKTVPLSDYGAYWSSAKTLWSEGKYECSVTGGLVFRAWKPPGMAMYLAPFYGLFGDSTFPGQCLNAVLLLAGNVLLYFLLADRLGRDIAAMSVILLVCWPSRFFSPVLLGYDPPGSFLIILFWWLAEGPWRSRNLALFASGTIAGLATLLKIPLIVLVPVFCLYRLLIGGHRTWTRCLWMGTGLLMVLGCWTYRNHQVLGHPIVTSTQGGYALYGGYHPQAGRTFTHAGWDELAAQGRSDELTINRLGWRKGFDLIKNDPLGAAWRVVRKLYTLLESDHELTAWAFDSARGPWGPRTYGVLRNIACGLSDVWYVWFCLWALWNSRHAARAVQTHPVLIWPILTLCTGMGLYGLFQAIPRYTVMYQCLWAAIGGVLYQSTREQEGRDKSAHP